MKESIASALIIVFLCSLCFFTTNTTTRFCDEIKNYAVECFIGINEGDWSASAVMLEKAQNRFKQSASLLKTFCVHKDINDIGNALSLLRSAIISKNKDESLLQVSSLISCIDILSKTDLLSMDNIL